MVLKMRNYTNILSKVCSCADNFSLDSTTRQVLKFLLTAVASTKFRVHDELLLGVIRVCYYIALNSKVDSSVIKDENSGFHLNNIVELP